MLVADIPQPRLGNATGIFVADFERAVIVERTPDGLAAARRVGKKLGRPLGESAPPTSERLETLGGGWVAEEALAIALYCSMTSPDVESALSLAVTRLTVERGPSKGTSPVKSSNTTTAREKRSAAGPITSSPRTCSGAMYIGDPATTPSS
jgi:hypothetical protein